MTLQVPGYPDAPRRSCSTPRERGACQAQHQDAVMDALDPKPLLDDLARELGEVHELLDVAGIPRRREGEPAHVLTAAARLGRLIRDLHATRDHLRLHGEALATALLPADPRCHLRNQFRA